MGLTGRFNLRKTFSGRIILQVEEEKKSFWSFLAKEPKLRRRWRDATMMDLAAVELRPLMDMRDRTYNPFSHLATRTPPQPAHQPEPTLPVAVQKDFDVNRVRAIAH
jgi:hypothetical protein